MAGGAVNDGGVAGYGVNKGRQRCRVNSGTATAAESLLSAAPPRSPWGGRLTHSNTPPNIGFSLTKDNCEWGAVEGERTGVLKGHLFVGLSHCKVRD